MATSDYLDGSFGIIKGTGNSNNNVEIITGSISGVVKSYSDAKTLTIEFSNLENDADIIFEEGTILAVTFPNSSTEIEGILALNFYDDNEVKFKDQDGTLTEGISSFNIINGEGVYRDNSDGGEVDALQFVIISATQAAVIDTYYNFITQVTNSGYPTRFSRFNKVTKVILNEATVGGSGNPIASHKDKTGRKIGSHYRDSASSSDFQTYSTGLADSNGYYPVGVVGWDSNSRFYRLLSAKLINIRVLAETDGSNNYVGWAADLYWRIHNPYTSESTATLVVYILWLKL